MPSIGDWMPRVLDDSTLMPSLSARCLTSATTAPWLDGESWPSALTVDSSVLLLVLADVLIEFTSHILLWRGVAGSYAGRRGV